MNSRCLAILCAMCHYEGAFSARSLPFRDFNPLDLRNWGSTPVVDGFARFPTMVAGVEAGYKDVLANVGKPLRTFIFKFAPPNENNTNAYLDWVSEWTGIKPEEPI